MKILKYINVLILCVGIVVFTGCDTNEPSSGVEKGYLSVPQVTLDSNVDVMPLSRTVDVAGFSVLISQDDETVKYYDSYTELPPIIELPVGNYSVTASYGDFGETGFDMPCYIGTQEFEIRNNLVTEVEPIVCRLSNIMVSVRLSDRLRANVNRNSYVQVGYMGSEDVLVYTLDIIDAATIGYFPFFENGEELVVRLNGMVNGEMVTSTVICDNLKPGQHRVVSFGLKTEDGADPEMIIPDDTNTSTDMVKQSRQIEWR